MRLSVIPPVLFLDSTNGRMPEARRRDTRRETLLRSDREPVDDVVDGR
jgi:hypothetical protein